MKFKFLAFFEHLLKEGNKEGIDQNYAFQLNDANCVGAKKIIFYVYQLYYVYILICFYFD